MTSSMLSRASPESWLRREWPTTICRDRYGGVYSGGEWLAWPLRPQHIPAEVSSEDGPCRDWWLEQAQEEKVPVGVGSSPTEALERLRARMLSLGGQPHSQE